MNSQTGPVTPPASCDAQDSRNVVVALHRWAIETALPLWATAGFDDRYGNFHERLHLDGTPDRDAPRRVRVQARQIYVYSHAALLGWYPDGLNLALRAYEFMLERCRSKDGRRGFVHRVTSDGSVEDPLHDLYDHAFILLAFSWLALASKDSHIVSVIDETLAFIDEHLAAGDGTFFESLPPAEPRRQNPHMHLFEAMLALHQTIRYPTALQRAQPLRNLLRAKFIEPGTGVLLENFASDWRRWPGSDGEAVEPGHHAEWSWLLRTHDRMMGRQADPLAGELLGAAIKMSGDAAGFLVDEVDRFGGIRRSSRRCWPQTELAKAWLAEAEIGRPCAEVAARNALHGLQDQYLSGPVPGGWIDQFDSAGAPMADFIPASTFYHLFCAIAEADRVLK